jgi:hypothetical protein
VDDEDLPSRLSRIATQWTLIRQAHGSCEDEALQAQALLLERYQRAIYSYLVAASLQTNPDYN